MLNFNHEKPKTKSLESQDLFFAVEADVPEDLQYVIDSWKKS